MAVNMETTTPIDYRKQLPTEFISQENGQRRYGGPPPQWTGERPHRGNEVFVGKLPRRIDEQALWALVNQPAIVYELRVMIDFSGDNRGFAFVVYTSKEDARRAVTFLNNREVMPNRRIGCVPSVDNRRLFVGGLPRETSIDQVKAELTRLVEGVTDVILYPSATDKTKNRGFAFVEFIDHRMAALARQRMTREKTQAFGQLLCVDWAEPEQQVDEETMSHVRILYVRNLLLSTEETSLRDAFDAVTPGQIEKAKKIKDFAFVHFRSREAASIALEKMNNSILDGAVLEVMWAKPPDRTIMKQVRSSLKTSTQQQPPLMPGNPFDMCAPMMPFPTTPTDWAYAGSPLIDTTQRAMEQPTALPQHDRVLNRLARGAAGTRGVGFQSYVNNQMRRTRRRFMDNHQMMAGNAADATTMHGFSVMPPYLTTPFISPIDVNQQLAFMQQQQLMQLALAQQQQHLLEGMTPMTLSTSPTSMITAVDILAQMCSVRGWGQPIYELQILSSPDEGEDDVVVYVYRVTIALLSLTVTTETPSDTEEEAKQSAAQSAIARLNVIVNEVEANVPFVYMPQGIVGQ